MTAGTAANRTTTSASLAAIGRNGDERVTGPMAPGRASRPDLPGSLCAPPIAESRIVLDFGERGVHLLELPPDPLDEAADVGPVPLAGGTGLEAVAMHQEIGRASCRERVCQYV